jgi:hypothetical protein
VPDLASSAVSAGAGLRYASGRLFRHFSRPAPSYPAHRVLTVPQKGVASARYTRRVLVPAISASAGRVRRTVKQTTPADYRWFIFALTLPKRSTGLDDGLLTASEVAQLKLNAYWVALSACNTAVANKPGSKAPSGLARAFFYADARALLISHWSVDSEATTPTRCHGKHRQDARCRTRRAPPLSHPLPGALASAVSQAQAMR